MGSDCASSAFGASGASVDASDADGCASCASCADGCASCASVGASGATCSVEGALLEVRMVGGREPPLIPRTLALKNDRIESI